MTSNKEFGRWGKVFGDDTAAAILDRLVHHADMNVLKGASYRLKPRPRPHPHPNRRPTMTTSTGATFNRRQQARFQPSLTSLTFGPRPSDCPVMTAAFKAAVTAP